MGEPWITAVEEFEKLLNMVKARSRVKAARDLGEVAEGLRIVVRPFPGIYATVYLTASLPGSNEITRILSGTIQAHPRERYNEHASNANVDSPQIQTPIFLPATAGAKRCS